MMVLMTRESRIKPKVRTLLVVIYPLRPNGGWHQRLLKRPFNPTRRNLAAAIAAIPLQSD